MKRFSLLPFLLLLFFSAISQTSNPNYDAALAEKLGADEYGMKSYVLVILKTGSNTNKDPEFLNRCFRSHFENMTKMTEAGKLLVAGPIGTNELTYRGIFILNVATFEEANELLKGDETVANGIFDVELFNWYGSAALGEYLPASDKIWRVKP
jgi:uncharacterized protein YciI